MIEACKAKFPPNNIMYMCHDMTRDRLVDIFGAGKSLPFWKAVMNSVQKKKGKKREIGTKQKG